MIPSGFPTYCYGVDVNDDLAWVDSSWLGFANENGASDLTKTPIQGKCLWDFIADESTRNLYREIHRRVRSTGRAIVLPLRCDSPNLKRYMQLTISPGFSGALDYRCILHRVELQPRLTILEYSTKRSSDMLTMCSCCKKVCVEPMGWVHVEAVAAKLHLFDSDTVPQLQYLVCPECVSAPVPANST